MDTIGVHMALYRMLSELLESHTQTHSNFPGPMDAGFVEASRLFWRSRQRGAVAGEYPSFLACLAHEEEEDRHAAWKGGRLPAEESSLSCLASPLL